MSFDWLDWIPDRIKQGEAYIPGEQKNTRDWIKLNTNEFPYPPSPRVPEAIALATRDLRYYPNPTGKDLRDCLAAHHAVEEGSIVVFNGCDDALNCCIRGFVDVGERVAMLNPSYSLYGTLIQNHGAERVLVDYLDGFEFPRDALMQCDAKMIMLTSPNAPSGRAFCEEDLVFLLENKNAIFILDETYADFSDWSAIPLIERYENLVVVRSFSKTYGLAGLRVGYAIAQSGAVSALHQIRDVYNSNRLSQAGALAALLDTEYYREKHSELLATRNEFTRFLGEKLQWNYYPSSTNFVFCFPKTKSGATGVAIVKSLFEFLIENHVLVRYFSNHSLVESGLRVSIGTPEEMETVKNLFEKWAHKE